MDDFIDAWFCFHPQQASERGYLRYDTRVPSYDPEDIARFRAAVERARGELSEVVVRRLSAERRLEFETLQGHVAMATFPLDRLDALGSNPLFFVRAALDGLETLELRGPSAWEGLRGRLLGLERLCEQARDWGRTPMEPAREAALAMLEGGSEHLRQAYRRGQVPAALAEAADQGRRALDRHRAWLEDLPARDFQPMGEEAYVDLLAHEHRLPREIGAWRSLARRTLECANQELERRPYPPALPEPPEDFGRREVLQYYRWEIEQVRAFLLSRSLVGVPEGELLLGETPAYLRDLIPGAFYHPPALFLGSRTGRFFVPPVPEAMDTSVRRRFHAQVAGRSFRNLVVHELWPGHHLQFLHAACRPRPVRDLRDNDVMVEGWALYAESLMQEEGLFQGRPCPRPTEALRFRALRMLIDIGLHTGELSLSQAEETLARELGVPRTTWMEREVRRYALEPTQAFSYLAGAHLIRELREEYLERTRGRSGLRDFHDRFLAEGSVPVPLIRRKMLDDAESGRTWSIPTR